jgi:hypothetical protein
MAAMEKDELNSKELLKLYELAINEEHHFLKAHHDRAVFYWGIISALIAGTIAGVFNASEWYHFIALCIGPVLIFMVSAIAIKGTGRPYQRFLEAVTVRAKIQEELGLTKDRSSNADEADFWRREPIVPLRHMKSRKDRDCKTSREWVNKHLKRGYRLWTICLFLGFLVLSILMCNGILALAIYKAV